MERRPGGRVRFPPQPIADLRLVLVPYLGARFSLASDITQLYSFFTLFMPTNALPMNSGQVGTNARLVCSRTRWYSIHKEVPGRGIAFWYARAKWHLRCQESGHRRRWPNLYRCVANFYLNFWLDACMGTTVPEGMPHLRTRDKWFVMAPKGVWSSALYPKGAPPE